MTELHILPSQEDAVGAAVDFVANVATERIASAGWFTIALSGGSTPCALYQLLASPPYITTLPWDRWHVFWGDERCVSPDHPDSNYRMAKEALLDHVPIPSGQIHRMRGEAEPAGAASEYEETLRRIFEMGKPSMDLVLLGMGEDGHVASLFPETDALAERRRLVVANWVPYLKVHRITFSLPLINAAKTVMFLVTDAAKADVLQNVLEPSGNEPPPPAALVRPDTGPVHWFLTQGAASRLVHRAGSPRGYS